MSLFVHDIYLSKVTHNKVTQPGLLLSMSSVALYFTESVCIYKHSSIRFTKRLDYKRLYFSLYFLFKDYIFFVLLSSV